MRILSGPHYGKVGTNLAYPLLDSAGRMQGVLTTQLDLDWLGGLLTRNDFPPTTALVLTDSSGEGSFPLSRSPEIYRQIFTGFPVQAMASGDEGVTAGIGLSGNACLFAFVRLSPPWQEIWLLSASPGIGPWARLIASCSATSSGWAWWRFLPWPQPVRREPLFVQPVKKLRILTERLAAGDLSAVAWPRLHGGRAGPPG